MNKLNKNIIKHKYFHKISSHLYPFILFINFILILIVYSFFHSSYSEIPDLQSYLQSYLQDFDSFYQLLLFSSPSFERPTLSFQPSRDEFVFVPPPMSSETFLYTPINLSSHNQQLHKYHLSWQKPLEKEDYPEVCLLYASFDYYRFSIVQMYWRNSAISLSLHHPMRKQRSSHNSWKWI